MWMTPAGPFIIGNDKIGALQKKILVISLELARIDVCPCECFIMPGLPNIEYRNHAVMEVWQKYEQYIRT